MPRLISLFGTSSVGKSTLLDRYTDHPNVGLIEIGKEMRRRHPPEYFNGFGAMEKTEQEVWEIFDEQFRAACKAGKHTIVCDGQPRMVKQVQVMYSNYGVFDMCILHAPREVLIERAKKRVQESEDDQYSSQAALEFQMKRLDNDYFQLYDVLLAYLSAEWRGRHRIYDTTHERWVERADLFIRERI